VVRGAWIDGYHWLGFAFAPRALGLFGPDLLATAGTDFGSGCAALSTRSMMATGPAAARSGSQPMKGIECRSSDLPPQFHAVITPFIIRIDLIIIRMFFVDILLHWCFAVLWSH